MQKEIDNFLLQVAFSIYRYDIHEDISMLLNDLEDLWVDIEPIRDVSQIYIGPLNTQPIYKYTVDDAFSSISYLLYQYRHDIYKSPTYVPDPLIESIRHIKHDYVACVLLVLYFLYGERVLTHIGLMYRLQHLEWTNLISVQQYTTAVCGHKRLDQFKHTIPMFKRIFEALSLITNEVANNRTYGISEIFRYIYNGQELPIKVPLNLVSHPSIKKMYLRHILHNPEDVRYVDVFNEIYTSSSRYERLAVYYFSQSIGGAYILTSNYSTKLSSWYKGELDEKQLDGVFDDILVEEKRTFEELGQLGIGIAVDANIRLTKKRFSKIKRCVENREIAEYKELAGPFLIRDSSMIACKILRRQIHD